MNYVKRFALASSGAALVLLLYTAAAQLPSLTRADHVALLVLVSLALGVVSGAIAAALVRKNSIAMLLVAQVLTVLIVGVIWNR